MKALYEMVGLSKQAHHKFNIINAQRQSKQENLIHQAKTIRASHPQMGCRSMYELMNDPGVGRDECERILLASGFRLKRKPGYIKTTVSQRTHNFPNLINGLRIQGINHVWQTDITYFIIPTVGVFYLIFIIDVYSRRIIAYTGNTHMRSEANVACLKMALRTREGHDLSNLIHHSDHGGQYVSKAYLDLLQPFKISMAKEAWQNAYTERINGTIKNDYLRHRSIESCTQLNRHLKKDIFLYNNDRPHRNLPAKMSPVNFEEYLKRTPKKQHPILKIYDPEQKQIRSELPLTESFMETLFRFP